MTEKRVDLDAFAGESVTITLYTKGSAAVGIENARIYQDSDGDGLLDYRERQEWTIPWGPGDTFTLDPHDPDTDGDGLSDSEEVTLGPVPSKRGTTLEVSSASSNPAKADTDGDGLGDSVETARDTSAFVADSDYDGLDDGTEVLDVGTDPLEIDTDGDGLSDGTEADPIRIVRPVQETVKTDPLDPDSDGDRYEDGTEVGEKLRTRSSEMGYRAYSHPTKSDTDDDGLSDYFEGHTRSDIWDEDTDGDGIIDGQDPRPTTRKPTQTTHTELDKAIAFAAGATLGEWGFPNGKRADSPYYMLGWVVASVVPGFDIVTGARDLVAAVKDGKGFDAALETVALLPIIGKAGDLTGVVRTASKWGSKFKSKLGVAQQLLTETVMKHAPNSLNAKLYSALGAEDIVVELTSRGFTNSDLAKLKNNIPEEMPLQKVDSAWKLGDEVLWTTKARLEHSVERHVGGKDVLSSPETTFWPSGQTGSDINKIDDSQLNLPNQMEGSASSVKSLTDDALQRMPESIKAVRADDEGRSVIYEVGVEQPGIDRIEVIVKQHPKIKGKIWNVYPKSGNSIYKYVPGNGWQPNKPT